MFFFFLLKKILILIEMLFSYSSFQTASNEFVIWNKYFFKSVIIFIVLSWIF